MIEITNKQRGPIQLIVRSKNAPKEFKTLIVPGYGKGKNKILIEDERWLAYIDEHRKSGLITVRQVDNV